MANWTSSVLTLGIAVVSTIAARVYQKQRDGLDLAGREQRDAKREAQEKLAQSYLDQARANRLSGQVGHRFETFKIIQKAIVLARTLELPASFFDQLRNEAIATMTLPDPPGEGTGRHFRTDSHGPA